jgi:hypothetical protein
MEFLLQAFPGPKTRRGRIDINRGLLPLWRVEGAEHAGLGDDKVQRCQVVQKRSSARREENSGSKRIKKYARY